SAAARARSGFPPARPRPRRADDLCHPPAGRGGGAGQLERGLGGRKDHFSEYNARRMLIKRIAAACFLLSLPVTAMAQGPDTFCKEKYALCIKAPCKPIVTRKADGTYEITEANCLCVVETGWSMGSGSCDSRKPVREDGH